MPTIPITAFLSLATSRLFLVMVLLFVLALTLGGCDDATPTPPVVQRLDVNGTVVACVKAAVHGQRCVICGHGDHLGVSCDWSAATDGGR